MEMEMAMTADGAAATAFRRGAISGAMVMQWLEMNSRWCGRMDENEGGSRWWCSLLVFAAAAICNGGAGTSMVARRGVAMVKVALLFVVAGRREGAVEMEVEISGEL
ncbi:hypothetical protein DEO72_LG5g1793 [Vigna unguiculata]|uniref:Uncharacterized protein n=1 Tax=Vigna unguiculata TaxID=3917 RepID=A0A4D6LYE6_VIGUN|nr:hypothetical protein DEO72_LG5g1793 [Vigna unguiculata]